jgi:hypothetical protein
MQTIIEIIATHRDVEKDESRLSRFLEHREQGLPIFKHVPVDQSIIDLGINGNNNALQTTFKLQIHPSRLEHVDFAFGVVRSTHNVFSGCRLPAPGAMDTAGPRLDLIALQPCTKDLVEGTYVPILTLHAHVPQYFVSWGAIVHRLCSIRRSMFTRSFVPCKLVKFYQDSVQSNRKAVAGGLTS